MQETTLDSIDDELAKLIDETNANVVAARIAALAELGKALGVTKTSLKARLNGLRKAAADKAKAEVEANGTEQAEPYDEAATLAELMKLVNEPNDDVIASKIEELAQRKKAKTGQPIKQCRDAINALWKKVKVAHEATQRAKAEEAAKAAAKARAKAKAEAGGEDEGTIRERILDALSAGTAPEWMLQVSVTWKGAIRPSVANVALILRNEPGLARLYRLNVMDHATWLKTKCPPWVKPAEFKDHVVADNDAIELQIFMQQQVNQTIAKSTVQDAIDAVAAADTFNPLADYLGRCHAEWDGKPRIGKFLAGYLGARHRSFSEAKLLCLLGRKFLISAVARALQPGCKVDHSPLITGPQGIGKSSAVRTLCPDPDWFSDSLPADLGSKDAMSHLSGVWLIEVAEFDKFKGRSAQELKAFLTKQSDRFRPSYGRREVTIKRCSVFLGTANPEEPLGDQSGNRRFWPAVVEKPIDIGRIAADRDQIWGEAVEAFEAGEAWYLDLKKHARLIGLLTETQAAHTQTDPWEPTIARWLDLPHWIFQPGDDRTGPGGNVFGPKPDLGPGDFVYIDDIHTFALQIPKPDRTRHDSDRVVSILTRLGWRKSDKRHRTAGWQWLRPEDDGTGSSGE